MLSHTFIRCHVEGCVALFSILQRLPTKARLGSLSFALLQVSLIVVYSRTDAHQQEGLLILLEPELQKHHLPFPSVGLQIACRVPIWAASLSSLGVLYILDLHVLF